MLKRVMGDVTADIKLVNAEFTQACWPLRSVRITSSALNGETAAEAVPQVARRACQAAGDAGSTLLTGCNVGMRRFSAAWEVGSTHGTPVGTFSTTSDATVPDSAGACHRSKTVPRPLPPTSLRAPSLSGPPSRRNGCSRAAKPLTVRLRSRLAWRRPSSSGFVTRRGPMPRGARRRSVGLRRAAMLPRIQRMHRAKSRLLRRSRNSNLSWPQ
jgi:hypothetical protein